MKSGESPNNVDFGQTRTLKRKAKIQGYPSNLAPSIMNDKIL